MIRINATVASDLSIHNPRPHLSPQLINHIETTKRKPYHQLDSNTQRILHHQTTQTCLINKDRPGLGLGALLPRRQVVLRPTGTTSSATPLLSAWSRRTSSTGSTTPPAQRMAKALLLRHLDTVLAPVPTGVRRKSASCGSVQMTTLLHTSAARFVTAYTN